MENETLQNQPIPPILKSGGENSLKFILKIFVAFLIPVLIVFLIFISWSSPRGFKENTIVSIEKGSSLREVSLILKNKNIIKSRSAFEAFVVAYGGEKHIADGDYLFEKKTRVYEVARRIAKKERHLEPIKVTIPEGYNVADIALAFSEKLPEFDKDNFILKAKEYEGYLFPDTYFVFTESSISEVISLMRANYKKKIEPIRPLIKNSGRSEKEIIVMASIVEREAKGDDDRAMIAGILWKRILIGMPLQTDAALETYKNKGLPEKPISNPGIESIKDTLNPKSSPYLFYLHDKNGIIHYARDFNEHRRNIVKYLK